MSLYSDGSVISEIRPTLYLGNQLAAQSREILAAHGIKRIVSVIEQPSRMPSRELCEELDLYHAVFAIPDDEFDPGENELVKEVFPWIREGEIRSEPVLVHCHASVSRSPSLMVTYLVWRDDLSAEKALELVGNAHKLAAPKPLVLRSFLQCINKELPETYAGWLSSRRSAEV